MFNDGNGAYQPKVINPESFFVVIKNLPDVFFCVHGRIVFCLKRASYASQMASSHLMP